MMKPAAEGWREAACRLTSRQTTVAANIAEREVLVACCQGDRGQPGSASFADANETSQLLKTHAKPPLETQTEQPPPRRMAPAHTWAVNRGEGETQQFICFSRLLVMCLLCALSAPLGKEGLLLVVLASTLPSSLQWHLSSLSPLPFHWFSVLNWVFQWGGWKVACAVE